MAREVVCELCGGTFMCQTGIMECWCNQITLTFEASEELGGMAKDCVCPACLTRFESYNSGATA